MHLAALLCTLAAAGAQAANPPQKPPVETAPQSETQALKRLSIEELSRIAVVSASRHTEPMADAATAVGVITADTIRRAGITNLPDALRLALGVTVGRDGNAWAISARGFQASATNKMVVMIDGRSIYTPLFSGVFWDVQDVLLADVDRIEVIRSAGGTLWGANAVNGVINIITKLAKDTQGGLVQIGGGNAQSIVGARYGTKLGDDGRIRAYAKFRQFDPLPYVVSTTPSDDKLRGTQAGFRFDRGTNSALSFTVQGDAYAQNLGLASPDDNASGGNVLARVRRTYRSGAQLQGQAYFDTTFRRIPAQYTERRYSGEFELQYRFSAGRRHDIVSGVGAFLTHDRVTPSAVFFFEPDARTLPLLNVFAQDEITLAPGKLAVIVGSKFEHNDYTGFEYQPTARLRWTPRRAQTVWGGVSRAVRMPSRFDTDLRFTAGTPTVIIRGSETFESERVISTEGGYRIADLLGKVAVGVTVFSNQYEKLRSQEPTPPIGFPIVLANKHKGTVQGVEFAVHVEPVPAWQIWAQYGYLHEDFSFEPGSGDPTGGSLEHNDPSHQWRLRSFADLPGRFELDVNWRWVGALPQPAVQSYAEMTLRVARPISKNMEVELIGDNLLHEQHVEFVQLGPVHAVPRAFYVRLTWRSR